MSEQRKRRTLGVVGQRIIALACVAIVGLAILTGIGYGLWRAFLAIEHGALAALALGAALLIPVAGLAGWKLGHLEARGVLAGLGLGVDSVLGAASGVADVRVNTIRTVREIQTPVTSQAVLPMIDVTPRHLADGERGEIYM